MRSIFAWFFVVVASTAPIFLLATTDGSSASFYALLAISLGVLATSRSPAPGDGASLRAYAKLGIACALLPAAVLVSQAWHGVWHGSDFEKALRLVLVFLILAAALRVPREQLRYSWLGIMIGAWYSAIYMVWLVTHTTSKRPLTKEINSVSYGDLTLLFAVLSLFSLGFQVTNHPRIERAVKLATALAGFTGFMLTQTRGGLLAIPVFILIGLFGVGRLSIRRAIAGVAILSAAFVLAMQADTSLRWRVHEGVKQYQHCSVAPLDNTSVCIRLQLWRAAWEMFKSSPVVGIGGGEFRERLDTYRQQGRVSAHVAQGYGEAHNDMLFYLATYGLLGLAGMLAMYAGPAWMFARRLRAREGITRAAAAAGLAFCLGFVVFGLTEMMFRSMRVASFYATWVAVFLALSHPARAKMPPP